MAGDSGEVMEGDFDDMGIAAGTVGATLHQARLALARHLGEPPPVALPPGATAPGTGDRGAVPEPTDPTSIDGALP